MKKLIYTLLFIFLGITPAIAQNQQEIIENMREEVSFLASDQLEGRQTGSKGEQIAAEYIKNKFKSYNLTPKGEDNYFQYFEANVKKNPHSQEIKSKII